MNKLNYLLGLIVVAIVTSCGTQAAKTDHKANELPAMKVKVEEVKNSSNELAFNYNGVIEPKVLTTLNFQAMGTVQQVFVEEGDLVKKGALLAKLDATSAESAYKASLATQKQAQDAYDRLKTVYDKGSLTEIQWEEIKTKLEQANASVEISKHQFENTTLKAPFDGVIGRRNIELGSSVNPAFSSFEIVTIDKVYARISVPEHEIGLFDKGLVGVVNIPAVGAQNYEAKVEKIGVLANQLSKTYAVKLSIMNTDLKIKPGMVCDANISIHDDANYLTVPMQAIVNEPNSNPYVYVLNKENNTVSERNIKVGAFSNSEVQVISGLIKGEWVVVNGQQKLVNEMKVSI